MFKRLDDMEKKFDTLAQELSKPEVISNQTKYAEYAKAYSDLEEIVLKYREYKQCCVELDDAHEIIEASGEDAELVALAKDEAEALAERKEDLENELKILLTPKDPRDSKNVIVEIRAGAVGDEAALFAADLFRMYVKYAEIRGWKTELISDSPSELGGFKEVIFGISGRGVFSRMKYESGVHRVQRVPVTETGGRIHTSTATVAVLPEAEEVEVDIDPNDLRIDVYRSTGPGGQSVNTTDSAVRITHIPTGMVVSCQDEKSQHKNRAKALRILRARLLSLAEEAQRTQIAEERKSQVGTGDRSERIRTYNFPQNRVTDHRIGLTLHRLESVLEGDLDEVIETLIVADEAERVKGLDWSNG
jgi:peptide chain release factor 1